MWVGRLKFVAVVTFGLELFARERGEHFAVVDIIGEVTVSRGIEIARHGFVEQCQIVLTHAKHQERRSLLFGIFHEGRHDVV